LEIGDWKIGDSGSTAFTCVGLGEGKCVVEGFALAVVFADATTGSAVGAGESWDDNTALNSAATM
jgi:hypothetical protein